MKTEILYEDSELLVVYKPAGIATQAAGAFQIDVVSELKNYLASSKKGRAEGKEPYLGIVHRLDQPVEGLLVFAKTKQAAAKLSGQAAQRVLKKEYLAAVSMEDENRLQQSKAVTLTDYLVKDGGTNLSFVGKESDKNAKKAVLSYTVVKTKKTEGFTAALLKIRLETGRHHQIRVQLANAGMPLLGDLKYGTPYSRSMSQKLEVKDTALCAHKLNFRHPNTGKAEEFTVLPRKAVLQELTG